jgi:hypothetical protein
VYRNRTLLISHGYHHTFTSPRRWKSLLAWAKKWTVFCAPLFLVFYNGLYSLIILVCRPCSWCTCWLFPWRRVHSWFDILASNFSNQHYHHEELVMHQLLLQPGQINTVPDETISNQPCRSVCFLKVFIFLINAVHMVLLSVFYVLFKCNGLLLAVVNYHSCNAPIACILTSLISCF